MPCGKSRTGKDRRDVDRDFVEQAGIQELLDGVGAVDLMAMNVGNVRSLATASRLGG
jgi:hypothetical protein